MIPLIDLSGEPSDVAEEIGWACTDVGFFQVVGHGVDASVIDAAYVARDQLVGLSALDKAALASPTGHVFRGWSLYRGSDGSPYIERFQVNAYDDAAAAMRAGIDEAYSAFFHPNVWPSGLAGFETAVRSYHATTRVLGRSIMGLFARALGLPPTYFVPFIDRDVSTFAFNIYPGGVQTDTDFGGARLIPEHTDSGTLTILHQRGDYLGLEVRLRSGERIPVPVIEEAFVINIGDLMARWTDDRWVSTPHQVVSPSTPGCAGRTSLTTFHTPNVDAVICPLGDKPSRYEPVTPYVWEKQYLERQYAAYGTAGADAGRAQTP